VRVRRLMRTSGRVLVAAVLVFGSTHCGSDESLAEPTRCTTNGAECLDGKHLGVCVDGTFTIRDCDDDCSARSGSSSSLGCSLLDGPDECTCSVQSRPCEGDGPLTCASSRYVVHCVNGKAQSESCDCRDSGLINLGCQYLEAGKPSCVCASEGEPCASSFWDRCVGESSVARCEAGVWTVTPCEEVCAPAGALGCVFSTLRGEAACACEAP